MCKVFLCSDLAGCARVCMCARMGGLGRGVSVCACMWRGAGCGWVCRVLEMEPGPPAHTPVTAPPLNHILHPRELCLV
jgi:hypothetical protein